MSRRRKRYGGAGIAIVPWVWKQIDTVVGVGGLVLEFGVLEAIAATGVLIAVGPDVVRISRKGMARVQQRIGTVPRETKQPATRTWITGDGAFSIISKASWIERHRPAGDLEGLGQLAMLRRRVGAEATVGDHLIAELALKALLDFAEEIPSGVNSEGLYSKELLVWWVAERSAATVGLYDA